MNHCIRVCIPLLLFTQLLVAMDDAHKKVTSLLLTSWLMNNVKIVPFYYLNEQIIAKCFSPDTKNLLKGVFELRADTCFDKNGNIIIQYGFIRTSTCCLRNIDHHCLFEEHWQSYSSLFDGRKGEKIKYLRHYKIHDSGSRRDFVTKDLCINQPTIKVKYTDEFQALSISDDRKTVSINLHGHGITCPYALDMAISQDMRKVVIVLSNGMAYVIMQHEPDTLIREEFQDVEFVFQE